MLLVKARRLAVRWSSKDLVSHHVAGRRWDWTRRVNAVGVALATAGAVAGCSKPAVAADDAARTKPQVVTQNEAYIQGIKIYGIGILEDPVPGEKRGRGKQHLTSGYWTYDTGVFIERHFREMQTMAKYAHERSQKMPGYDFRYFINVSNALFLKAEQQGLRTKDSRDFFLMAGWCAMAAAEVDGFPYAKYDQAQRIVQRDDFYRKYMREHDDPESAVWLPGEADNPEIEEILGKFSVESCRIDMFPSVALERLGLHNELCAIKFKDPTEWMKTGFVVSARIDSMKRHYENIHAQDGNEDHLAHLIWGFMAVTHVVAVFPQRNDLIDFETIRRLNVLEADENIQRLVGAAGDGGFRTAVTSRRTNSRQIERASDSDELGAD